MDARGPIAAFLSILLLTAGSLAAAPREKKPPRDTARDKPKAPTLSGPEVAAKLRAEWDLGEVRMARVVCDDANAAPELKRTVGDAADTFLQQQESLLSQVERDPSTEAQAVRQRAQYLAAYNKKMNAAMRSPEMQKEMGRHMKALNTEMESLAKGADDLMAKLDSIGLTAQQKEKIRPVVAEAGGKVKAEVSRSDSRSPRDKKVRDGVVQSVKDAHRKIRDQLTPEQKEKLAKKLSGE